MNHLQRTLEAHGRISKLVDQEGTINSELTTMQTCKDEWELFERNSCVLMQLRP